jgi:hypothetical protein
MNRSVTLTLLATLLFTSVVLTGCGPRFSSFSTNPTTPIQPVGPTTNPGAAERIYVVQQPDNGNGTILQFAATASGVATAQSTIAPGTPVGHVATDSLGNIYAFNGNIVEFASGASGTPTPIREITGAAASRICCVDGLAVSPAGAIVIGQDNGEVDEWNSTASGAVAPERYILGQSETGGGLSPVNVANLVALNSADDIYVGAANAPGTPGIVLFNAAATGNIAASGTIGPDGLDFGLALDSLGNIYATTETCTISGENIACNGIISVYAANSSPSSAPIRVISGPLTQLASPGGLTVDSVGNIYVISTNFDGTNPTVLTFSKTATGNVAPTSSFTSTAWTKADFNPSIAIY